MQLISIRPRSHEPRPPAVRSILGMVADVRPRGPPTSRRRSAILRDAGRGSKRSPRSAPPRTRTYSAEMREFPPDHRARKMLSARPRQPRAHRASKLENRASTRTPATSATSISRQDHRPAAVLRRQRQAVHRHRSERAGMGLGGGVRAPSSPEPDVPVVSVVGDGSFLASSGPQPLWTQSRYKGADHQHRAQQSQLQQRAQTASGIYGAAGSSRTGPRHDLLPSGAQTVDYAKAAPGVRRRRARW